MTHVNQQVEIPGEKEDGMISSLPWLGEPTPEAWKAREYQKGEWNPESKRVGAVGIKVGMMNVWDARGVKTLLTVIKLDETEVTAIHKDWTEQGEKYVNLQVGAGRKNTRTVKKSELMSAIKGGHPPKKRYAEFEVSEDAVLPVGTKITARHFVPGQFVDVTGKTKGKGFQGVMKKYGYAGQPASHGTSLTHRSLGSIGQCQDPGKVWKGRKMPGRMGNRKRTHYNFMVYKLDIRRDYVFIKGSIPGNNGSMILMQDARFKKWNPEKPPPYPTFIPEENEEWYDEHVMDVSHLKDPFVFSNA